MIRGLIYIFINKQRPVSALTAEQGCFYSLRACTVQLKGDYNATTMSVHVEIIIHLLGSIQVCCAGIHACTCMNK